MSDGPRKGDYVTKCRSINRLGLAKLCRIVFKNQLMDLL